MINNNILIWTSITMIIIFTEVILSYINKKTDNLNLDFYTSEINKTKKRLYEIFAATLIASFSLNFMVFYSFWSLLNSFVPPQWTIVIVIIVSWFITNIFQDKISALIFIFMFINPLINNIESYNLTLIGAILGVTYLSYFIKNNKTESSNLKRHLSKFKICISIVIILICLPLYGIFPFSKPQIYQDLLEFDFYKKIINLLPLILLLMFCCFSKGYLFIIAFYVSSQLLTSFILGFTRDINSQNELNFIFSDLWIKNTFENTNFWILFIKTIYDMLKTLILWAFIVIIEEKVSFFKSKTCSNQAKISENRGIIKEFFKILAIELRFWGAKTTASELKGPENSAFIRQNFLFESSESLLKSLNPFGIFNVFVIFLISQNQEIDFSLVILSLLKFNWIIYCLIFIVIILNLVGKWSDFLFKNWEIDLSKLKDLKKTKIQVM
ncbi:hypothetical protein [Spiroplasma endosymbiont of Panorpa germanica]|uniref:hypothetical protein n=1 Tax=Spiroplasma endosymbiont of Panorpa germanica TaxID=3066314 RepID=UPI0030CEB0D9